MAFFLLQILSQKTYQEKYLVFFIKIVFAICAVFRYNICSYLPTIFLE